jgi:hypothetical protein
MTTVPLLLPEVEPPSCVVPLDVPLELPPTEPELELVLPPFEPLLLVLVAPLDPFPSRGFPELLPPFDEPLLPDEVPPLDDPVEPWPKVVCVPFEPQFAATPAAQRIAKV